MEANHRGPRSTSFDIIAHASPSGYRMECWTAAKLALLLYLIASKRSGQKMLQQVGSISWLRGRAAWEVCRRVAVFLTGRSCEIRITGP